MPQEFEGPVDKLHDWLIIVRPNEIDGREELGLRLNLPRENAERDSSKE